MHDESGDPHTGLPGVDENGFVELTTLRRAALDVDFEVYAQIYPVPGLLMEAVDATTLVEEDTDAVSSGLLTMNVRSIDVLPYLGRVGLVAKRPGNAFSHMISLGRTTTNDLVVDVRSLSKFHGFFQRQEGIWSFTDHRSTNGTYHNGKTLVAGERVELQSGDRLQFALDVAGRFLLPRDLYERVRG